MAGEGEGQVVRFKTVYADPPWHFDDKLDPTRRKPYDTLSLEDLMNLPILPLVESDAHIYLWATSSHLHDAFHLMDAWGFTYKTLIPWVKLTVTGKLHFGMGHYYRACHESCLFGVRGSMRTLTRNTRNILYAKRPPTHSAKPPEMYDLIEKNSPEPRLELFSRSTREGWTMIGEEVDGQDIEESLKLLGVNGGR